MPSFDKKKDVIEEKPQLTNIQRLMDIINNRKDNGIRQPYAFPDSPQEAAKYWIHFLEERMKYEIDTTKNLPYQERLADCLEIFYKLSTTDQRYLTSLREDKGIYWRGDSIEFMKKRECVTPEMIADKAKLMRVMRKMIGSMSMNH